MEELQLTVNSLEQLSAYRDENHLIKYEPEILNEMITAVERSDAETLQWFNRFGDSLRAVIINVYAYRKGLDFGFTEIAFNQYGWFKRPEFVSQEELVFGIGIRYGEYSTLKIGKGLTNVWTYALSYNFGTAGGGCGISFYGKQFNNRETAINTGITELKDMMKAKIGHSDTSNYKQPIIQDTLNTIAKYKIEWIQLKLF